MRRTRSSKSGDPSPMVLSAVPPSTGALVFSLLVVVGSVPPVGVVVLEEELPPHRLQARAHNMQPETSARRGPRFAKLPT